MEHPQLTKKTQIQETFSSDLRTEDIFRKTERTGYIYFLYYGGYLIYIGQTVALESRLKSHLKSKIFDTVTTVSCPEPDLRQMEAMYIEKYNPILNFLYKDIKTARIDDILITHHKKCFRIVGADILEPDDTVVGTISGKYAIVWDRKVDMGRTQYYTYKNNFKFTRINLETLETEEVEMGVPLGYKAVLSEGEYTIEEIVPFADLFKKAHDTCSKNGYKKNWIAFHLAKRVSEVSYPKVDECCKMFDMDVDTVVDIFRTQGVRVA